MNTVASDDEEIIQDALGITEQARSSGVPLRLIGACAVRIHCSKNMELHKFKMKRSITDLDLITLRKYQSSVKDIVKGAEYYPETKMVGMARDAYRKAGKGTAMDVFFDRLEMCHTIELGNRLEIDFPTITLADILLEKLQVVKINEKDVKDVIALLLEHEMGETDKETISVGYIARLLSDDWGFYYTLTMNLDKIKKMATTQYQDLLSSEQLKKIQTSIDVLLSRLEAEPKSTKWKLRQKVGTKKIWYREVEEVAMGSLTEYLMRKYEKERTHN